VVPLTVDLAANSLQSASDVVSNSFSNSIQSVYNSVYASSVNDIFSGSTSSNPRVVSAISPTSDIFSISANSTSDVVPVISPQLKFYPILIIFLDHYNSSLKLSHLYLHHQ
jgi:hypothetical protein